MTASILPPAPEALDRAELDAWCDELFEAAREAHEAALDGALREDGTLHHDRLPCDDVDSFNPHIVARAECPRPVILPAPVSSIWPGQLLRVTSWVTP